VTAVGDPVARDLLLAQRTMFAGPWAGAPADLYSSVERGVAVRERHRVALGAHALVSTNTYFGRFPAAYWQRWTSIDAVHVDVAVAGSGVLRLVASDSRGGERTVTSQQVEGGDGTPVRLAASIDRFVDGGALWLELETAATDLTAEHVRWSVAGPAECRATSVVICTYNRADDCIATLQTLASDPEARSLVTSLYVVDQGTDTVESREEFPSLREELGPVLRYIRQPNLGGAGGFTRGIYEVVGADGAEHHDVLLMDDDIRLEPDSVVRMTAFAQSTVAPTLVGGQMLNLLHPEQLHVGAERAELEILRAGKPVPEALVGTDVTKKQQDVRVDAGYNAWWSCLIPAEVVRAVGYPLPVFFQWDDIEYGLRAGAAGFPTVTLAGAGVWHADFEWKNWDDWSRYFSFRNSLIVSALHSDFDRRSISRHLGGQLATYLLSMQYGLAATMIRAVEDFLAGPGVLRDGGVDAAAAIRKLRAEYPETSIHAAHTIPGVSPRQVLLTPRAGTPSMPKAVLAKRAVWQLLQKNRGAAAISSDDAHWWHVSLFRTAIVSDPSQEGVRVHQFDRALMLSLARRGARVLLRLEREGARVRDEYRRAVPELTSRATWTRLFGGEQADGSAGSS
jgi:galactofuranosylgalactofuranosylrhamnosyl-N-acetylglucosaminyl-diphospho-decaprenol beta-1,5/1,6-galactofuranosyltransferase